MGMPRPSDGGGALLMMILLIILFMVAAFVVEYVSNPRFSNAVETTITDAYYAWLRIDLGVAKPARLEPPAQQPLMFSTAYVVGPSSFAASLAASAPRSSIRSVGGLGQAPRLPNGSVLIIDWDYVNQSLQVGPRRLADMLEEPWRGGETSSCCTPPTPDWFPSWRT